MQTSVSESHHLLSRATWLVPPALEDGGSCKSDGRDT